MAFADAADRDDLEALRSFYAPDVTWRLGARTFRGIDAVMAMHERDRALGARLERSNVRVVGDTVFHDLIEASTLFDLLRAPPLEHRGVAFVYDGGGRIVWKGPAPGHSTPGDSANAFLERYFGPFQRWWLEAHPELRDSLLTPDGGVRAGAASGRILLGLAREYVVLRYIDASNRHDLDWIRPLFTDDVTWDLAGDTRHGIDEVMAPHEQDVITDTHLDIDIERVAGDTVVGDVVERNTFLTALGLDSIAYPGTAFIFRGGRIEHLGPIGRVSDAPSPLQAALAPFFAWVRSKHPEDWAVLVDRDGRPRYGEEGGRTLLRLVNEWRVRQPSFR